ncbi:MAG: peptidoglycan DD-metalloendopeptidase family protein [Syntrophomonadaceae bacterium]|nr:peptidoglycan DD-metalloendopeptidase family protein [Syntrophomonadaceae bacterium]
MVAYLRYNKALFFITIAAVFAGVLFIGGVLLTRTPGYAVYINDEQVFAVKDKEGVEQAAQKIQQQAEKRHHQQLVLASPLDCKWRLVKKSTLVEPGELETRLAGNLDFKANAGAIIINKKTLTYVSSPAAANQVLAQLKKDYSQVESGEKIISLAFAEKVTVKPARVSVKQIMSETKAYDLITTGSKNPEKYTVKEGDSLWMIARKNDMYVDDIKKANHLDSENLSLGQKLVLVKSKPYINVVVRVKGEKTEEIPYQTKVITDQKSPSRVAISQNGKNGEKHIVYIASKRNGVVSKREIIEEKILRAAVDRVIVKGSGVTIASRSLTSRTGAMTWPLYGVITQYYGGGHRGIDVGVSYGTPIYAADGGVVYFSGYSGGYGYCVKIDHGNGLETNYAHCSKLVASSGQMVSKGQLIAYSGNSGRSTGPHLHFEVTSNGAYTNPISYLR